MAKNINHDLRVVNGGTLYMPPWEAGNDKWGNLEIPSVYAATTLQSYPTGTIWRHGLRTFVYTLSDPTYFGQKGVGNGSINAGYLAESASEMKIRTNSLITGAAGASTVQVDMGGSVAVNAYAGGFVGYKMGTGDRQTTGRSSFFQIISNTVSDGSDYVTFTMDGPIVIALDAGCDFVFTENPYAVCRAPYGAGPYGMCIGVYTNQGLASKYYWLQTGGPVNFMAINASYEGAENGFVPMRAIGGTVQSTTDSTSSILWASEEASAYQVIGHQYASTNIGGAEGSPTNITVSPAIFLNIFN